MSQARCIFRWVKSRVGVGVGAADGAATRGCGWVLELLEQLYLVPRLRLKLRAELELELGLWLQLSLDLDLGLEVAIELGPRWEA